MSMTVIRRFSGINYIGAATAKADKNALVFVFDVDSTLTHDPDRTIVYPSKEDYFDAAHSFGPNQQMLNYARRFVADGHRVAIATARPPQYLEQTIEWLETHNVPFDQIMLSTGDLPSSVAKQEMILDLQHYYKRVAYLYDDSPYNIEGAALQGVRGKQLKTNCRYWRENPEDVVPLGAI